MDFLLRIVTGTQAGAELGLKAEQSLRVGRGTAVELSIPQDPKLSSVHFELRVEKQSCVIRDLESTNGTFVNGKQISDATLRPGDRIRAGGTEFLLESARSARSAPGAPACQFGDWVLARIPQSWEVVDGIGIKALGPGGFFTNLAFTTEPLPHGKSLGEYVQIQIGHLQRHIPAAKTEPAAPDSVVGIDEAQSVLIHYPPQEGTTVCQKQTYVRSGGRVGILTLTSLEQSFSDAQQSLKSSLPDIRFHPQEQDH
jgi:hypothetical protein